MSEKLSPISGFEILHPECLPLLVDPRDHRRGSCPYCQGAVVILATRLDGDTTLRNHVFDAGSSGLHRCLHPLGPWR